MQRPRIVIGLLAAGLALALLGVVACGVQPMPASVSSTNLASNPGSVDPDPIASNQSRVSDSAYVGVSPAVGQRAKPDFDVIEVSGVGYAAGVPDIASLSLGVSVTAESVSQARTEAAATVQSVIEALKAEGIPAEDIATVRFTIRPEYDYVQGDEIFKGYQVLNRMQVIVRDIEEVGPAIDASIAAGGDSIVFNGLDFSFSDTKPLKLEAREAAVDDMADKAAQLARFAGRELGNLKKLSETAGAGTPFDDRQFAYALESAAVSDTPILAGQDEIRVFVYGVYELLPAGQ